MWAGKGLGVPALAVVAVSAHGLPAPRPPARRPPPHARTELRLLQVARGELTHVVREVHADAARELQHRLIGVARNGRGVLDGRADLGVSREQAEDKRADLLIGHNQSRRADDSNGDRMRI